MKLFDAFLYCGLFALGLVLRMPPALAMFSAAFTVIAGILGDIREQLATAQPATECCAGSDPVKTVEIRYGDYGITYPYLVIDGDGVDHRQD